MKTKDKTKEKERKKIEKNARRFEKFLDKETARDKKFEEKYGDPGLKKIVDKWGNDCPRLYEIYYSYKGDQRKSDIARKFAMVQSLIGTVFLFLWIFADSPSPAICGLLFLIISAESYSESRALYLRARLKGQMITTVDAMNNIPDKISEALDKKYKMEKK